MKWMENNGADRQIRTADLTLTKGALLPTEPYQQRDGAGSGNRTRIISLEGLGNSHYTMPANQYYFLSHLKESGGGGRIRTCEG